MARRLLPAVILIPALVGWVGWLGRQQGMLDRVMGLSLFVLTNIVILTALIWWNAASLNRMDRGRRRTERRLGIQYADDARSWRNHQGSTTPCPGSCKRSATAWVGRWVPCGGLTRRPACCGAATCGTRRRPRWMSSWP